MSEQWHEVTMLESLPDGEATCARVAGAKIALYRIGAEVYATDYTCTHGHANLCDGFLEGYEIECPLHQGRFDVRTGQASGGPVEVPLRRFAVRLDGGRVLVELDRRTA